MKEKLQPAIDELEQIGFLVPMPRDQRYRKEDGQWTVHFTRDAAASARPALEQTKPVPLPPLVDELVKRGVTAKAAAELVERHPAPHIEAKIEQFDWEMTQPKPPKQPAGYLVKSITDDYATPKGFISHAERQAREEAKQAKAREQAEQKRREREEEARQKAERQAINAYWESLTAEQQAELDTAALAQADADMRALTEGPTKRFGMTIVRDHYIRQLLASQQPADA
jgi:hypothetical protein